MGQDKREEPVSILDQYIRPRRSVSRLLVSIIMVVLFAVFVYIYKFEFVAKSVSPEMVKSSLEITNVSSEWIVKETIDSPDFKGIVLVPEITFQVRNIGDKELSYVYFLGVFRFLDTGKSLGEGYMMTLKKALKPGEISEKISLSSALGYRASSEMAFIRNQKDWRDSFVELYLRKSSKYLFVKSYYISKKIKGMNIDIKLGKTT